MIRIKQTEVYIKAPVFWKLLNCNMVLPCILGVQEYIHAHTCIYVYTHMAILSRSHKALFEV